MTTTALVRDIFRQARATGLTATLLAITVATALVCATAEVHSEPGTPGASLTILFGAVRVIDGATPDVAVRYLQFLLGALIADTGGILLALVWTAGFLPTFIDPGAASVLLAKPPARSALFLGRFFGVVVFVGVQALLFVGLTAIALGVRTGVWSAVYWLCVPLLLAQFTVFYSFSALLAVLTRHTAGCLVGSILFWIVCWSMNYGRHALIGLDVAQATEALVKTADAGYWLLPKPADFGLILYDALDADRFATPWIEFRRVQQRGLFLPLWSVVSSLAFAAVLLAVAVYEFVHDDY
jgi:ABC-type transport system involved in multi-copper enzyme maturation permease subunit